MNPVNKDTSINDKISIQYKKIASGEELLNDQKALLREKIAELNKEIKIYQAHNASLENIKKLKEEELKCIKKEKAQLEKLHDEQMTKLKNEYDEKFAQMKHEKISFQRLQKAKKDTEENKGKTELKALKQQLEKLEETKQKSIKFKYELKNVRNLLASVQKERDTLKYENECLTQRLNEMISTKAKSIPPLQNYRTKYKKAESLPLKENVSFISSETSSSNSEKHLRFNLVPEIINNNSDLGFSGDITDESETSNSNFKEINHGYKVERIYNNGDKEVIFKSGSRKYISADGLHTKFQYFNGDVEETFPDGRTVYTYADGITELQLKDGLRIFDDGEQVVKQFPDGLKQTTCPDKTVVIESPDGIKETKLINGDTVQLLKDGTAIILHANGEKETRTHDYTRYEYPDGIVKIAYKSGRCETHLRNGHVQVSNQKGNLLFDSTNFY